MYIGTGNTKEEALNNSIKQHLNEKILNEISSDTIETVITPLYNEYTKLVESIEDGLHKYAFLNAIQNHVEFYKTTILKHFLEDNKDRIVITNDRDKVMKMIEEKSRNEL